MYKHDIKNKMPQEIFWETKSIENILKKQKNKAIVKRETKTEFLLKILLEKSTFCNFGFKILDIKRHAT